MNTPISRKATARKYTEDFNSTPGFSAVCVPTVGYHAVFVEERDREWPYSSRLVRIILV